MADLPTLAEVAAAAGVSPATASRVLTGSVRVTTSTRRQVHDAMSRLGYVRRRAPRGSAGRGRIRSSPPSSANTVRVSSASRSTHGSCRPARRCSRPTACPWSS